MANTNMELSRQEYPALLTSLQPAQAVTVLNERVRLIGKINSDISEWLAERRRVEEAYVLGLKRLAARRPENPSSLGVFKAPWQSILASCETYADSHATLSQKICVDVEKPLREYATNGKEMSGITTIQGNLAAMAKEVEEAQKKSEKIMSKGAKADNAKITSALTGVQAATAQWESQAPFVFEQLQALDENRVNHLRDALTQLQTHEVDQLERSRGIAEQALNSLLNVDTAEEISTFVAATTNGAPSLGPRRQTRHSTQLSTSSAGPVTAAALEASAPPVPDIPQSLALPSSSMDDRRSIRSAATSETGSRRRESSAKANSRAMPPPETPKKSGFGGLRRLGTVMSRRNKEPKNPLAAPSPEKKAKSSRNPLRRASSSRNSMYQLNSPVASMTELADTSARQQAITSSADHPPSALPEPAETNGVDREETASTATPATSNDTPAGQQAAQDRRPRPPSTIQEEGEHHTSSGTSSALDAITRAQQEATALDGDQPQFKVDIRNEPIREEGDDAAKALSNTANALRAGVPQPPQRKTGTVRGRRDVRNTIFVPSGTTPESMLAAESSPLPAAVSPSSRVAEEHHGSDAQSIRSAHSLSSVAPGGIKHPEMTEPGLNASVVETISAWFTAGAITKAIAIGEVALVHNGSPSPTASSEPLRLENFATLEKVAPNPAFVTPIPEKSGEYIANVSALSRAQVAFKYQVHLAEENLSAHAPVLLTPTWKVEPSQTSVMLSYSFNPAFHSPRRSVSLQNVVLVITLEGAKATSCLSKPPGNFHKEKNLIYWRLGDLTLEDTSQIQSQKLLARFVTEGEAKPGGVEARWEITGGNAFGVGSGLSVSQGGPTPREEGSDPFADESGIPPVTGTSWKECAVTRKIVSGKYLAD